MVKFTSFNNYWRYLYRLLIIAAILAMSLPPGMAEARAPSEVSSPLRAGPEAEILPDWFTASPEAVGEPPPARPFLQAVSLSVQKTDSPDPVSPGDLITYIITATNSGPTRTTGVFVDDYTPENTTFDSSVTLNTGSSGGDPWVSLMPEYGGTGEVKWIGQPLGVFPFNGDSQLDSGEYAVFKMAVKVNNLLSDGTVITNTVTLSATNAASAATATITTTVSAPGLTLSKTASNDPVTPGLPLTYTIYVTNSGHYTLSAPYTLTERIPENLSFAAGNYTNPPAQGYDPASRVISWVLTNSIPSGSGVSATFVVTVNTPLTNGLKIVNDRYTVTSPSLLSPTLGSPLTVTVRSGPDLTVVKYDSPDPVGAGGQLAYTLVVTNEATSTGPALNLLVTDTVPAHTLFEAATGGVTVTSPAVGGSGVVTWEVPVLAVGASQTLYMTVTVQKPLTSGTVITNFYGATASDILTPANTSTTTTTVTSSPVITLSKSVWPSSVPSGGTVTYTVIITNSGNGPATLAVTDHLASGFTFKGMVAPPAPDYTSPEVVWQSLPLDGSDMSGTPAVISLIFTATAPLASGVYSNLVTATFGLSREVTGPTAPVYVGNPQLRLLKVDVPDPASAGGVLTYTLYYSNVTTTPAYGAFITDVLPANTAFVDTTGDFASYSGPTGGVVTWTLPTFNSASGRLSIVLTLTVASPLPNGTVLTNTAGISEPLGSYVIAVATTTVKSSHTLALTKSDAPDPVAAGARLTYTIGYNLTGSETALNTIITDSVPADTSYANCYGGTSCSASGGVITWSLGALSPGASGVVTLAVTVKTPLSGGTVLTNTGYISDSNGGTPASATTTTTVQSSHALAITKSDAPDPISAGGRLTYTIGYSLTGSETALNVTITDSVPGNADYEDCDGGESCSETGGVVTWDLGDLDPGASGVVTLVVTVWSPLPNGTALTNTARLFDSSGGTPVSATVTTTVQSSHTLALTKSDAPDPVAAGGRLTYTIGYSLTGNETALNATITDSVPGNADYEDCDGGESCSETGGVVTWDLGDLDPGASGVVTLVVTVWSPLPNGTALTNTARLSDGNDGTPVSATVTTTVQSSHTLVITKSDAPDPVAAGGLLTYTIGYSLTGNESAPNATITDSVPGNTEYDGCDGGVSCSESGGIVTWNLGTLEPGDSDVVTLVVVVGAPLLNGTVLTNTARLSDASGLASTATVTTTVVAVDLYITKTVRPSVALPGEIVTYTLIFTNYGGITATNVLIADVVPEEFTTIYSYSTSATPLAGTPPEYNWQVNALGPKVGGSIVITGPLAYTPWGPLTSTLTNTVSITAEEMTLDAGNLLYPNEAAVTHLARPGAPCVIALEADPNDTPVGSVVALTATVEDCWSNPVLNGTVITFSSSLAGSYVTSPGSTSNGEATASLTGTLPGTTTVVAAWPGSPAISGSVVVTFTTGDLHHFAIGYITSPQSACNSNFTVVITAQDSYSNTITSYDGTVDLVDSTGSVEPSASEEFVGGVWSGLVTITLPVRSDVITASDSISPAIIGVSNPFTVAPGSPSGKVISYTSPISICGARSWITTTVYDACNNPVWAGVPVTYSLVSPVLGTLPGGGSTHYATTDDQGQATTVFTSGSTAGSQWFLVSVKGLTPQLVMPGIEVTSPGQPTQLLLTASPASVPIGGSSTVTATLRDCADNLISGIGVSFSVSSLGAVSPASGTTDGNGSATTGFTAGSVGGVARVTATVGSLVASIPITIQTTDVTTVTVVAVPDTMAADGSSTTLITVTVMSTGSIPVVGQPVSLQILPTLGGSFLTSASGNTNSSGVFTATWQAGTIAGRTTVTATAGTHYGTAPLTLTAGAPALVVVYALPSTLVANGATTATITATVTDSYGNPVSGTTVALTVTPDFGGTFLTSNSGSTNSSGVFTAVWRSGTVTGTATVTATADGLTAVTNVITLTSGTSGSSTIYLPVVLKNAYWPMADLTVESIQLTPSSPSTSQETEITVAIKNAGPDPINTPFWVDLYIHDSSFANPTVNKKWNDLASYGVAWRVYTIQAGETLTLTNNWPNDLDNPSTTERCNNYSNFTPSTVDGCGPWYYLGKLNSNIFAHSGTWYIKAQVDSYSDTGDSLGIVHETDETNNTLSLPTVGVSGLSGEALTPPLRKTTPTEGPRPTVEPTE